MASARAALLVVAAVAAVAAVVGVGGCKGKSSPSPIVFGKTCEPFGVAAGLATKMPVTAARPLAAVNAKSLGTVEWSNNDAFMSTVLTSDSYAVRFRNGGVSEIQILVAGRKLDDLVAAWGPGTPTSKVTGRDRLFYRDGSKTTRCEVSTVVDALSIRFLPMVPLSTYLGDGPTLTFLGVRLLGQPVPEIEKSLTALGATVDATATEHSISSLPVTDGGNAPYIELTPEPDGAAAKIRITYAIETEPAKAELLARLAAKFGPPTTRDGATFYAIEGHDARFTISAELAKLTIL